MFSRSSLLLTSFVVAATLAGCSSAQKRDEEQQAKAQQEKIQAQKDAETKLFTQLKPEELRGLVEEGVVFGFPLVVSDQTKEVFTNPASPSPNKGTVNQFHHLRQFPDASFKDVVSPNADTLYSIAWLDLAKEPMVLAVPATGSRYYMIQMSDAWTNVFSSPGTRTTGNAAEEFVIVGPNWSGSVPANLRKIQAPTNMVALGGRVYARGGKDFELVHAIQDRFVLTPLSKYDRSVSVPAAPSEQASTAPAPQWVGSPNEMVTAMDAPTFFTHLSQLMVENPPTSEDAAMMAKLAKIGVTPGHTVDYASLPADVRKSLDEGVRSGYKRVQDLAKNRPGRMENGWVIGSDMGTYGTNYDNRAAVAWFGLGANLPEDAVYPTAANDSNGNELNGHHKYILTFKRGQLPPVNGFWSLTMYNEKQGFVANKLHRYSLGSKDKLKKNRDGSVSLFIQAANPGKAKVANWLPAPSGDFNLMMRLYWPKQSVLNGEWQPPGVRRATPTLKQRLSQKSLKRFPHKKLAKAQD